MQFFALTLVTGTGFETPRSLFRGYATNPEAPTACLEGTCSKFWDHKWVWRVLVATRSAFRGTCSMFWWYPHSVWRIAAFLELPATYLENACKTFGGSPQCVSEVLATCFRDHMFARATATYFGPGSVFHGPQCVSVGLHSVFWYYPQQSPGTGPQGMTSYFRCGCDWYSVLHVTVFRVVGASEL